MKYILTLLALSFSAVAMATHLLGGELRYSQTSESTYLVELIVYRDCGPNNVNGTSFDPQAFIGLWDGEGEIGIGDVLVADLDVASVVQIDPIEFPNGVCASVPSVCVERASYFVTINLPSSSYGYDLVWQRCCRSPSVTNLQNSLGVGGDGIGMTVKVHIPGDADGVPGGQNSTPEWTYQIPVAACMLQEFVWDCGGQDPDGDSLSFVLCAPLIGGDGFNAVPNPPSTPPFSEVPYASGFTPSMPLPVQDSVVLNPSTGVLSFTPSMPGSYTLGICVHEFRSGILINTVFRDIQMTVTLCEPTCDDSGACLNDVDGDGVCDELEIPGCVAVEATNYNELATDDDGSCEYDSSVWPGCMDELACNFNPSATEDDGTCFFPPGGFDCAGNSLCGQSSLSSLTVEVSEGAWEGLDVYRLYVNLPSIENMYVSAVAADQEVAIPFAQRLAVFIDAPEGVFNSSFNTSWSAQGIASAFVAVFPELAFDSFATIGLTGPASESLEPNAIDPSFVGDTQTTNQFNDFFLTSGATNLDMINGTYYILPSAFSQGLADEQGRCLIGQITTSGLLQGQLIVQLLQADGAGGVSSDEGETVRFLFRDEGVFQGVTSDFESTSSLDALAQTPVCGCNDPSAVNFIPWVEVGIDSCEYLCIQDADNDGVCDEVDDCVGAFDECGICNGPGANLECGCVGIPIGDCDCEGNQLDVLGVCGGSCNSDINGNGVCDDSEVLGCTYPLAENFSPQATLDDGTCIFPCEGQVNVNVFDWDGDYMVTVTDFLMMLTVYGDVDVDLDGVWDSGDDCVDTNACNYASDPSEPCAYLDILGVCGGGCAADEDADGVCDDVDECVGVVDECGVCNGPGPTEVVIENITIMYDSVYAEQIDTWFVFEVGADTTFSYTCAPSFSACGDPVSYQGYDYATVLIGDQCWFAENLRSELYRNGDTILSNLSTMSEWFTAVGAVAIYGEEDVCYDSADFSPDIDACDETQSLNEFGRLYNWYAVNDPRGLCPTGWHVPTDNEWTTITNELGGQSIAGMKMKTTYGWSEGGNGNNASGFSGLPGGYRDWNNHSYYAGWLGRWWSSTPVSDSEAWGRQLEYLDIDIDATVSELNNGLSIRCIKDAE